jgi:hypothetical protein
MSTLTVDTIETDLGQSVLVNGYPTRPNRILEYVASPCDGSIVTTASGQYSWPNVTTQQGGSAAYQTVTGSDIYYCPPPGTREVKYQFTFSLYWVPNSTHSINDYKFYVGDNEILRARHNRSAQYIENRYMFEWTIPINGILNNNVGSVATWHEAKRLYMTFRWYGSANNSNHHGTTYWDGTTSNQFNIPILSIVATT